MNVFCECEQYVNVDKINERIMCQCCVIRANVRIHVKCLFIEHKRIIMGVDCRYLRSVSFARLVTFWV